ncbi:MAG: hypothetical protein P4L74_03850 [Candidatus Doudnabacteria bacterium]|nr:hypothetical protein [Candidatus Doudnabacteria bacterium]
MESPEDCHLGEGLAPQKFFQPNPAGVFHEVVAEGMNGGYLPA